VGPAWKRYARVVADTVAAPIEQQVNGIEGMLQMISRSGNDGSYMLHLTFRPGTDMNIAQVLVQNRVSLALPAVPDAVQQAGINVKKIVPGVFLFAVLYSPDDRYDARYLGNYARIQLRDELGRLAGVSAVTLFGASDLNLRIQLDPDRLAARGLTAGDVLKALREQNGLRAEQFEDVVVKASENTAIRLKDVARLEVGGGSPRGFVYLDGKPVVALGLSALPKAHPRDISARVRKRMEKLRILPARSGVRPAGSTGSTRRKPSVGWPAPGSWARSKIRELSIPAGKASWSGAAKSCCKPKACSTYWHCRRTHSGGQHHEAHASRFALRRPGSFPARRSPPIGGGPPASRATARGHRCRGELPRCQ